MSLDERFRRLQREIEREHGEGDVFLAAVVCNGCGESVTRESVGELRLAVFGWRLGEYGGEDYCPACR